MQQLTESKDTVTGRCHSRGDPSGVRGRGSSMKMLGSTVHPGAEAELRVILMA